MRPGMNPTLEELLRRPDPAVSVQVELAVVTKAHKRNKNQDWLDADGGGFPVGFQLTESGSLRLTATVSTTLELITSDGVHTDLDRDTPFNVAQCSWGGTEPEDWELREITAHLDPDTGGGKNVAFWVGQLFALERVVGIQDLREFHLVPLHGPIIVVAGASVGDVTFTPPTGVEIRPKLMGPPENGGTDFPDPTTFFFVFAIKNDGSSATNVGWSRDSTVGLVDTASNILDGVSLVQDDDGTYEVPGGIFTPRCSFRAGAFTAATVTWTTNLFDLGAAPASGERVQLIALAEIPSGTSALFEIRNDADSAWLTFVDGDFADTLTGVTNKQTYKMRVTLTPDTGGDLTPVLVEIGIAAVIVEDVSEIVDVGNIGWGFDPPTLRGEISELAMRGLTDPPRDFNDLLTELLANNDLADMLLRIYVGSPNLAREFWLHIDDYFIDDVAWASGEYRILGISVIHLLRSTLPKFDDVLNERTRLEFTNTGLKTFYESIMNNEIAVPARFVGPGVEDDATQITDKIDDSDGKLEIDAGAYLDGRTVLTSQGRIKAVKVLDGFGIAGVFPLDEIELVQVTPGLRQRSPEFVVPWDFDFVANDFTQEVRRIHLASLTKQGSAKLDTEKVLARVVARKIDTQTLASKVAQAYADAFGPGLIQIDFRPVYAFPELEPGDMVAVQFEGLAIKDPNTGRSIRGVLWGYGPIRRCVGWRNDAISVWIRSYSDIFSSIDDVIRRAFKTPTIIMVTPTVSSGGDVSVTVQTRNALSVRVKATNISFPTKTQVQAEPVLETDVDGVASSGSLVVLGEGETAYISALAHERVDGTGRESDDLVKVRAVEDSNHELIATNVNDGWSATQNAAAPENGNVFLNDDLEEAFSNLEDANGRTTSFKLQWTVLTTGMAVGNDVDLVFYTNDGPTSTTWTQRFKRKYEQGLASFDDDVTLIVAMGTDFDFRVQLVYTLPPGVQKAEIQMHGEDNAKPGVVFTVPSLKTIGDRYVLPVGVDLWA